MNRTIKFRIYNKKSHKWEEPAPLFALGLDGELIHIYNDDGEYVYQQFTGLRDKNGKEIFEGDIVRWIVVPRWLRYDYEFEEWEKQGKIMEEAIKVVEWKYNAFRCFSSSPFPPYDNETCEIIGNIFDNPELLK